MMGVPVQTDSESLVKGTIRCSNCRAENSNERKFCSECGSGLWNSCPKCETAVTVSEKFCGACGLNIPEAKEASRSQFLKQLQRARDLAAERQFEQAMKLAQRLIKSPHGSNPNEIEALTTKIKLWESELDSYVEDASRTIEKARAAVSELRFEAARKMLLELDEAYVTDEVQALIAKCDTSLSEIRQLRSKIESAVAANKAAGLLPSIERLLGLTPQDVKLKKLAEKIRDQLLLAAKKRKDAGEFEAALKTVTRIPRFVATEQSALLADEIETMCCLLRNLKSATHVDPSLVDTLSRLMKAAPQMSGVAKHATELKKRAARIKGAKPVQFPRWSNSSSTQADEPCPGSRNTDLLPWHEAFDHAHFLDDAGGAFACRFVIAAGLALQGLGKASIPTDVSASDRGGWMSKVRSLGKRTANTAWGLHFGSTALKVVQLEADQKETRPRIVKSLVVPYEQSLSSLTNDFERREQIRNAAAEAQKVCNFAEGTVVAAFNSITLLARFISMPKTDDKRVEVLIKNEAAHQIPFSLDEVFWTYHLHEADSTDESRGLLILAARRAELTVLKEMVETVGIKIAAVQGECVALHNAFEFCRADSSLVEKLGLEQHEAIGLLQLGGDNSSLVLSKPNRLWFRQFSIGSQQFNRSLAIDLQETQERAEQIKKQPIRYPHVHKVFGTLSRVTQEICYEISRSVEGAQRDQVFLNPQRLFVVGGGSQVHGLIRAFRNGPDQLLVRQDELKQDEFQVLIND